MSAIWGEDLPAVERHTPLSDRFVVPPFSVFDTRQAYWQERRRAWLVLGIRSELGRGDDLLALAPAEEARARWAGALRAFEEEDSTSAGTSIFDPVLCEIAYRWFCPEGGSVLDPFAGGSVRGIVAARLGHPYTGIDLSARQLEANREQARLILGDPPAPAWPAPVWYEGDSRAVIPRLPQSCDLVFSCPPYYDLERYSDDPADLSAKRTFADFAEAYGAIIAAAAGRLRSDRFMVLVVSEIRDRDGFCHGLVPATIELAGRAGLRLYNEAVLINSAGSLPLRVGNYMEASRKLGRAHQNVLVFIKGNPARGWSYDREPPPSPQLDMGMGGSR